MTDAVPVFFVNVDGVSIQVYCLNWVIKIIYINGDESDVTVGFTS